MGAQVGITWCCTTIIKLAFMWGNCHSEMRGSLKVTEQALCHLVCQPRALALQQPSPRWVPRKSHPTCCRPSSRFDDGQPPPLRDHEGPGSPAVRESPHSRHHPSASCELRFPLSGTCHFVSKLSVDQGFSPKVLTTLTWVVISIN